MSTQPLRPRAGITAAAALALTVGLAGCAASDPNSAGSASDKPTTLVVAYRNQVTTIDPARANYAQTDSVDQAFYDSLVTYDEKGAIVPSLATSAKLSDDATSVKVTLRDGAVFHSGSPITAEDVKYSLDRYKALGIGIAGQIPSYKSTDVVDTNNLVIHLSKSDSLFLGALSRIYILDSKLVEKNAGSDSGQGWLLDHDAGSGPYTLSSGSNGTYTLERFAKYFAFKDNRPNTLVLRRIDDASTTKQDLIAGNIQVGTIAAHDASDVSSAGLATAQTSTSTAYVYMNNSGGATANPAVREAIRLAYDYTGGLAKFRGDAGTIAAGPLPSSLACRPDLPTSKQDLAAAKKVLADAGITNLTLTMRYQPAFAEQAQEATLLQSNLASIGVTLDLVPIAYADYLTLLSSFSTVPELMLATNAAPYPDAGVMLTQEFSSIAVGTNKDAFSDPEVDSLLTAAASESDASARCTDYKKVQTIVDKANAIMPMYTVANTIASAKNVSGTDRTAPNGSLAIAQLTVAK
jgi:peptide/nickel transport system substrate-binding protein